MNLNDSSKSSLKIVKEITLSFDGSFNTLLDLPEVPPKLPYKRHNKNVQLYIALAL